MEKIQNDGRKPELLRFRERKMISDPFQIPNPYFTVFQLE